MVKLEGTDHAHARHFLGLHVGHVAAIELPFAGVRGVKAGHQVEERGLAGAVRANQGGDAVAFDFEMLDVHGGHATELAGHVVGHQNRVRLVHAGRVLHEFQIFGDFVAVGGGDQGLAFGGFGGPLGEVVERLAGFVRAARQIRRRHAGDGLVGFGCAAAHGFA